MTGVLVRSREDMRCHGEEGHGKNEAEIRVSHVKELQGTHGATRSEKQGRSLSGAFRGNMAVLTP